MADDENKNDRPITPELQNLLEKSRMPLFEQQDKFKEISRSILQAVLAPRRDINTFSSITQELKDVLKFSALENIKFQISFPAINAMKNLNQSLSQSFANSIQGVLKNYSAIAKVLRTPTINWLRSFDFSPLAEVLHSLAITPDLSRRYKELNEIYLQTMYETKWFPYAGWVANMNLFQEVNEIIGTSRGASKNREKRIDKAILSYYTETEISNIKKAWWHSDLDYCLRRTLSQALKAYSRGEYALTISCLSTMWEGLIYIKAKNVPSTERKKQYMSDTKKELKELVKYNDYAQIFSDYFDNFIVKACNGVSDVEDGVPNRHGVAHSWYKKYPNKKAALNAILLTDFIIGLKPLEQSEQAAVDADE